MGSSAPHMNANAMESREREEVPRKTSRGWPTLVDKHARELGSYPAPLLDDQS